MSQCSRLSHVVAVAVLAMSLPGASYAAAPGFPAKPVRIVVGWPPGGLADIASRTVAEQLAALWKQPVIVDNRAGASGAIAADFVARSPADGYTLLAIMPDHVILRAVQPKPAGSPNADFAPVSQLGIAPLLVMVNPKVGVETIQDLVALAKRKPNALTYATPGAASMHHLSQALLNSQTGVQMMHIPYKGGAPAMMDAIGGVVDMTLGSPAQSLAYVQSGKLKALAVTSSKRSALLPEIPTVSETVLPGFAAGLWVGVLAPAGTPDALVRQIGADIRKVMTQSSVRSKLQEQGVDVVASTPEQFSAFMREEEVRWTEVVKKAGVTAN
ncbi:Tripartite tricarboxylate transporter family receptor [Pigmentiphaga humi]|uniref:Tripartite tricarboxylate transporter family receptor n=1 Tax=Pigmentiphaga humi TaxID=2478468 RepID=A0A3P4AYX9_9BURK|nr:tripartite tricarboxylate transporter substrate binding protein [Pigmentiphaga humi]VCU69243.1 Tripartite tricarboxylate transporter family receptor [Pigmentiphaga humi]